MTLTEIFRNALRAQCNGDQGINSYEWHGEPLFRGNPIAGHLTAMERKAVDAVYIAIKSGEYDG